MKLIVNNIRSFPGEHIIEIKPLTILVGENSTGKTTLLGCLDSVLSREFPGFKPGLNKSPYDMGGYNTIATYKGGSYGRATSFVLGFKETNREVRATYINQNNNPTLKNLYHKLENEEMYVDFHEGNTKLVFRSDKLDEEMELESNESDFENLPSSLFDLVISNEKFQNVLKSDKYIDIIRHILPLLQEINSSEGPSYSLAPVRTRPLRTYDEVSERFIPEGDHVPFWLSKISYEGGQNKELYFKLLKEFGIESGLFTNIKVQRLKRSTTPFEIKVNSNGPDFNLVDVGYGVSQALPIIAESIRKSGWVLMQQPEVHLHPRAQAALGTFFTKITNKLNSKFVIETHSDYLLNRIRMEVANGKIDYNDVAIYFLDKSKHETYLHDLKLDPNGNLLNVPDNYRKFFLEEELNLLRRGN